ncbi:MAG: hypothetical protein AB9846_13900 [Tenuifilaceae bacterium]
MARYLILVLFLLQTLFIPAQTKESLRIAQIDSLISFYSNEMENNKSWKTINSDGIVEKKIFLFIKKRIGGFASTSFSKDTFVYVIKHNLGYIKDNITIKTTYFYENNKLVKYHSVETRNEKDIDKDSAKVFYAINAYFANSRLIEKIEVEKIKTKQRIEFNPKNALGMAKIELDASLDIIRYFDEKERHMIDDE